MVNLGLAFRSVPHFETSAIHSPGIGHVTCPQASMLEVHPAEMAGGEVNRSVFDPIANHQGG